MRYVIAIVGAIVMMAGAIAWAVVTTDGPADQRPLEWAQSAPPSVTGAPYVEEGVGSAPVRCERKHGFCIEWPMATRPERTFVPSRGEADAYYLYQQRKGGTFNNVQVLHYWENGSWVGWEYLIREVTRGCTSRLRVERAIGQRGGRFIDCVIEVGPSAFHELRMEGVLMRRGDRVIFAHTIMAHEEGRIYRDRFSRSLLATHS